MPPPLIVTVLPEIDATEALLPEKVTGNPLELVAEMVKDGSPTVFAESGANVMVCVVLSIVKSCCTTVAAL